MKTADKAHAAGVEAGRAFAEGMTSQLALISRHHGTHELKTLHRKLAQLTARR